MLLRKIEKGRRLNMYFKTWVSTHNEKIFWKHPHLYTRGSAERKYARVIVCHGVWLSFGLFNWRTEVNIFSCLKLFLILCIRMKFDLKAERKWDGFKKHGDVCQTGTALLLWCKWTQTVWVAFSPSSGCWEAHAEGASRPARVASCFLDVILLCPQMFSSNPILRTTLMTRCPNAATREVGFHRWMWSS